MELKLINLEKCFEEAIKQNRKYIGTKLKTSLMDHSQINIISDCFEDELSAIKEYYNEDLSSKIIPDVRIIGFTFGDTFASLEEDLIGK